jgi:WD40 repeat protein
VYGLCFSPNEIEITNDKKEKKKYGLMIATCSADKYIKIWEVPTGKLVKTLEGHTNHVLDVGWAMDGKLLASAGGDNDVKIWDFEKGEKSRDLKAAHGKQVTRLQFVGKKNEIITCGGDAGVKMFNAVNGGVLKTFAGNTDFIFAVSASPDGTLVAAGGQEGVVRLYNGTSGVVIRVLLPPDAQPPPMKVEDKKPMKEDKKK